jgi:hypothetical protein
MIFNNLEGKAAASIGLPETKHQSRALSLEEANGSANLFVPVTHLA